MEANSLVSQLPRTEWGKLRGSVPPSLSAETKARIDGFARGVEGAPVEEIVKALGPPQLYAEESPGKGQLHYLWLDGSLLSLRIESSRLQGVTGSFQTE